MPVNEFTRNDALKFRNWWAGRVTSGLNPESANKDFGHLSEMLNTWFRLKKIDLDNPFSKMLS